MYLRHKRGTPFWEMPIAYFANSLNFKLLGLPYLAGIIQFNLFSLGLLGK